MTFRLAQISDCHLGPEPDFDYRGIRPLDTLRTVIEQLAGERPDALLVTGDVSEDGSEESFALAAEAIDALDVPTVAVPGNHDHPGRMQPHFPIGPWDGPLSLRVDEWQLVLCDSTLSNDPAGGFSPEHIERIDSALRQHQERPTLVALHHQPMPVGSPWIDRFPLRDPEPFRSLVRRHRQVRAVTWGHIHQAWSCHEDGVDWFGAPSTAVNALAGGPRFESSGEGPGYRWFELEPDGRLASGCRFVGGGQD